MMTLKLIAVGLFLGLISLTALAEENQTFAKNIYGNITPTEEKLLIDAFTYLNKFWADKGKSLSRDLTEKYFTPDTTLIINGKSVYKGYDQFESHFKEVGKKIIGKINFPLLEAIGADNKLIVHFNEDIRDNAGNFYPTNVMAIFTLENNKIKKWEEVVNTPYFCQPESISIVYSK